MALSKSQVAEIVKTYGKNEKDTGSTEVQIALLTANIKNLTEHVKANPQDNNSRRGLMILVGQRHGLLAYLDKKDHTSYVDLLAKLQIRK